MPLAQLLDGSIGAVIGGIIGAIGTGAAQVWSYRQGKKSARTDQSIATATDLLCTLYATKDTLRLLPYTEHAAAARHCLTGNEATAPGPCSTNYAAPRSSRHPCSPTAS